MALARVHLPVILLMFAPATVLAQGQPATSTPASSAQAAAAATSAGGAAGTATVATTGGATASDAPAKPTVSATGYGYSDPKPRSRGTSGKAHRRVAHVSGPIATLPGFEMLADGGSRLFVQLTQSVPVEEKRSAKTVTYVLKGAHIARYNNERPLVTVHFNTPVSRARLVPHGGDLTFIVDLRANVQPTYKMEAAKDGGAILTIDFPKGDFLPNAPAPPPIAGDDSGGADGAGETQDTSEPQQAPNTK